ncbi:hypothetical protein ART_2447 [Arthrobacter sp. PAMC 25486]|uniref:cupredoxin domain-containing protein n=1 Tax=Arthrobacter sp. PAMC 25486 TaxID=1494608 RepID=UPI000535B0CD|nr:cupredoxin domain-containing protein [Arthrobacter sp. PAMC 25486]AIY02046.1 hypothetical protein ART_2447 [Arthrobacter sp. PAMC 25486]
MKIGSAPPVVPAGKTPMNRAGWHMRANAPAVFWLVALVVVVLFHRNIPVSGWLMVHLLLLGAVTNSILVWSWHFAQALLRGPTPDNRLMIARLVLLNAAVVTVVAGMVADVWVLVLAGSIGVGLVVAWHAVVLGLRARKALASRFGPTVWYYVSACLLLPVGAGVGAALAAGPGGELHTRLLLVHMSVNVLGFVGLSVLGTLMTLLPTMLRTRVADGAETVARHGAVPLLVGVLAIAGGAAAGVMVLSVLGLLVYISAVIYICIPLAKVVRAKVPVSFASLSAVAALAWLLVALVWLLILALAAPNWEGLHRGIEVVVPVLAAGFVAQVLGGALTYLVPVVLGGGPAVLKRRTAILDRAAWFRVVLINVGLLVSLLPVPSIVRVGTTFLVLIGLAWFLPLLGMALFSRDARAVPGPVADGRGALDSGTAAAGYDTAPRKRLGMAAAGLAVVVLVIAAGVLADPSALEWQNQAGAATGVVATGETTTVDMTMKNMRFHPDKVQVPAGNKLVINLVNEDNMVHDLVTELGADSGRLYPGERTVVDVGVVGADVAGWCSVVGHRQQGMVLSIVAVGAPPAAGADSGGADTGGSDAGMPGMDHGSAMDGPPATFDFMNEPAADFTPRSAVLPALPAGTGTS